MKKKALIIFSLFAVFASLSCGCSSFKTGFIPLDDGGKLYYEEKGKGEPLILLHGHSLDTRMWDEQFSAFAHGFHTIRFDFRGYGRSSEQSETLQMTHVDDLVSLMNYLHIPRAHIVGLSMGAFTAGDMLALYPDRMLSCVLVSGGIRNSPGPTEPMDSAESARRDEEIAALKVKGIDQYKQEWFQALMASGGSEKERMSEPLWQMISDWSAWQPLHKEVRLFYGKEAWTILRKRGKTNVPTLILRGENEVRDPVQKPGEMPYLSDVKYVVVPDCGHMMNMEQPDMFNKIVKSFLKSKK